MSHEFLGVWYCHFVDQEQSDEEADEFGEYDDFGASREQKAAKTEFADAKLELFEDGRFELVAQDYNSSRGTWSVDGDGELSLREDEDSINGYDGLEWASFSGERFTIAFKLNPDSHDGLDILVLKFGREAPAQKGGSAEGFVAQLLEVEDEDELWEVLDRALDEQAERAARAEELWDAWTEGRIAADPEHEGYWLQTQAFGDERLAKAGGFRHRHARHALTKLRYAEERDMFNTVCDALATLPADADADAELAPLLASADEGKWLAELVSSRFIQGGVPDALFERPLLPRAETDEAARTYLDASAFRYFTRFEAIPDLYPAGHPELAKIVIRYRGVGLLDKPLALIEARGVEAEALAAALAWIEQREGDGDKLVSAVGLSAMLFAVILLVRAGQELPSLVLDALAAEGRGMIVGSLSNDEKARLREIVAGLPDAQRALVHKRFWLDPG